MTVEFYRITSTTLPGFLPLIPEEYLELLATSQDTYAIGAVEDNVGCGVLVFRVTEVEMDIVWIGVAEGYRRKGCASGMIRWLCQYADQGPMGVTCTFSWEDGREPIYLLFEQMPEFNLSHQEGQLCRLPAEELDKSPILNKLKNSDLQLYPVFQLPKQLQRSLLKGDIDFSLREEDYVSPLCLCSLDGDKVTAAILFQPGARADELYLAYAFCRPETPKALLTIFARAAEVIRTEREDCRTITLAAATPAAEAMVKKLFPQVRRAGGYCQANWDMEYMTRGGDDNG